MRSRWCPYEEHKRRRDTVAAQSWPASFSVLEPRTLHSRPQGHRAGGGRVCWETEADGLSSLLDFFTDPATERGFLRPDNRGSLSLPTKCGVVAFVVSSCCPASERGFFFSCSPSPSPTQRLPAREVYPLRLLPLRPQRGRGPGEGGQCRDSAAGLPAPVLRVRKPGDFHQNRVRGGRRVPSRVGTPPPPDAVAEGPGHSLDAAGCEVCRALLTTPWRPSHRISLVSPYGLG